jgi:hypothetical protein
MRKCKMIDILSRHLVNQSQSLAIFGNEHHNTERVLNMYSDLIFEGKMKRKEIVNCIRSYKK